MNDIESTESSTVNRLSDSSAATSCTLLPNLSLNDNKAGMDSLDKDRINEIIRAASIGSNYYNHQLKRQQKIDSKIKEMKLKLEAFTSTEIENATKKMDEIVLKLEAGRDLSQTVVHVDMDAFYAAVEMRENPALKDKPIAVGSKSMLSTSNYIARRYGVRAAMPGFIGLKLCENLVIVPLNFKKYREVSEDVRSIFKEYDPDFCPLSLDEAYLNITKYLNKANEDALSEHAVTAEEIVREMREKVFAKTQLTCSAGIAPNCMLAKICSDKQKPNGQYSIPPDKNIIQEFLSTLPIRKVCGIGSQTEQILNALGVNNCVDILKVRGTISLLFSSTSYKWFLEVALGIGSVCMRSDESSRKSMSLERTFSDTNDIIKLLEWCREFCEELVTDMKRDQTVAKTVTLKLKTSQFDVKTRAITLPEYTADIEKIFSAARKLLEKEVGSLKEKSSMIRLMGVRLSSLLDESEHNKSNCQRDIPGLFQEWSKKICLEEEYTCPMCNEQFYSLLDINRHVDLCLAQSSEVSNVESNNTTKSDDCWETNSLVKTKNTEINQVTHHEKNSNNNICKSKVNQKTLHECLTSQAFNAKISQVTERNASTETTKNIQVICPVCKTTQNLAKMEDINLHLDICINKDVHGTLQTIKSPDKFTGIAKKSNKKKANNQTKDNKRLKIDHFFSSAN